MTMSVPMPESSKKLPPLAAETALEDAWFDAPPSSRSGSVPPPSAQVKVGEFVGDTLVDAWLRD